MLVKPGSVHGVVEIPSSKSYTQRLFLLSSFLGVPLRLQDVGFSEDENVALDIARKVGARVTVKGSTVDIEPAFACPEEIDAIESGTSARLSIALLAGNRCRTKVFGRPGLLRRPFGELADFLSANGAELEFSHDAISVDGSNVNIARTIIPGNTSSQFVSAALLFLASAGGEHEELTVTGDIVSKSYIDITMDCLRMIGVSCGWKGRKIWVEKHVQHRSVLEVSVEPDFSSASFLYLLSLFKASGVVELRGLRGGSIQPDSAILEILDSCKARMLGETLIIDGPGHIKIRENVDIEQSPDLAPVLAVAGLFLHDGISIWGVSRLRHKESDRLIEIQRLVSAFGGNAILSGETLRIVPPAKVLNPGSLDFTDHRMIMAGIVAGIVSGYSVKHHNVERIAKSYPKFLQHLSMLGINFELLDH